MHCSRMRAARLLTVSRSIPYILGGESAQPPGMQTPPPQVCVLGRGVFLTPTLHADLTGCRHPPPDANRAMNLIRFKKYQ